MTWSFRNKSFKNKFLLKRLVSLKILFGVFTWKEWKTLQFRVKQASRRKINVRLGGSATLLVYFMFNDSGFRKKCCRYLHHSSHRHFYCRLMMILQELCKCFIMFHHLQISDINSTKYFGMSLCTLELSVIFLAIWRVFFALWELYYPYQMVHTLLPREFGTPLSTFDLLFWPLFFFFIEFGSVFWRVCVWEFWFLCSFSASSAWWCLMLSYFCVLLKDIFQGLLWCVDPTLLLSTSFYCHSRVSSYYFIWAETFFISSSCVYSSVDSLCIL